MTDRDRRLMWLEVCAQFIIRDWKHCDARTIQVIDNPLPEDAKVLHVEYKPDFNVIRLLVHSDTFDVVIDDRDIPNFPGPTFKDWTGRVRLEPIE